METLSIKGNYFTANYVESITKPKLLSLDKMYYKIDTDLNITTDFDFNIMGSPEFKNLTVYSCEFTVSLISGSSITIALNYSDLPREKIVEIFNGVENFNDEQIAEAVNKMHQELIIMAKEKIASEGATEAGRALRGELDALNNLIKNLMSDPFGGDIEQNKAAIAQAVAEMKSLLGITGEEQDNNSATDAIEAARSLLGIQ